MRKREVMSSWKKVWEGWENTFVRVSIELLNSIQDDTMLLTVKITNSTHSP